MPPKEIVSTGKRFRDLDGPKNNPEIGNNTDFCAFLIAKTEIPVNLTVSFNRRKSSAGVRYIIEHAVSYHKLARVPGFGVRACGTPSESQRPAERAVDGYGTEHCLGLLAGDMLARRRRNRGLQTTPVIR
jgi:hypothetical protein